MQKKTKMLIIGIDGGTFELILPMLKEGKLPNFSYLYANGAAGICESTIPPMTFPAWSTFLTGCNPGQHGIYDFTKFQPNSYKIRFLNARSCKAATFFQILSESGLRVAMIGVPTTYPPEPLNGVVISGFDCPVTTSSPGLRRKRQTRLVQCLDETTPARARPNANIPAPCILVAALTISESVLRRD